MADTVREILAKSEAYLTGKGVDSPRLSARLLVARALDMDTVGLFLSLDRPLTEQELAAARDLVRRRGNGEPVAYILGEKEFYGLGFTVTPEVLIPRPETELIIDLVEKMFSHSPDIVFADLGAGSGALAVTLTRRLAGAEGAAVDISPGALAVARENAVRHGVKDRLLFVRGDFAQAFKSGSLDLVVSNPPYVSEAEYAGISREITRYEPRAALVPGRSGLEAYERIVPSARSALKPGGVLIMEIGCAQVQAVTRILKADSSRWREITVHKDLAGRDRAVCATK